MRMHSRLKPLVIANLRRLEELRATRALQRCYDRWNELTALEGLGAFRIERALERVERRARDGGNGDI